ncbi:MAG TPA: alpha/beta hydrolase domain-containing protein, partial [Bryobacteraceae bacterium]|nr:alpha/beta hydrolase domain-containing protein [Bryobacteraceae bacterium]
VDCAIGTFTGWNVRHARIGLEQYLLSNTGSYLPFPRTTAERAQIGDPRRSIQERYSDQNQYLACIDARSQALISAGLLLPGDKQSIREAAARHWQWRMQQVPLFTSAQRE